jgi:hypothetical protein
VPHVNANLLEFFGYPWPAVAAEAQARLLLDMGQNDHVHVLPTAGGAAAEGPQATRADIHHPAQPVDRESPAFAMVARTNGATWLTLRRTGTLSRFACKPLPGSAITAFGSRRTGWLPKKQRKRFLGRTFPVFA